MSVNREEALFAAEQHGHVAVIRLKENLVRNFTDLNLKEGLFRFLHDAEKDETVRVFLIIGNPEKISPQEIVALYSEWMSSVAGINQVTRVYNSINQVIMMLRRMTKMVVYADSGDIIALFLSLSMACDYRIVDEKTCFRFPSHALGLIPKGGGLFFLSSVIGKGRTMELMLSGRDITAQEALTMGIVDRVAPSGEVEQQALTIADGIGQKPMSLTIGLKKLLNFTSTDLAAFLEAENTLLLDCLRKDEFQECLGKCL
jgi:2-(1,2-epoxy-1,2-dihydrophenyl)acetyl-CoA isomerase